MKIKDSYHPYAIIAIVFWSLAYVLTRLTAGHFSASSLGFLRCFIASCVMLPLVLSGRIRLPRKADIPWFILSGATGFFLYMITFNQGQAIVSASTGSVIVATTPVITALLARFFYAEKLSPVKWLAIGIEFLGVSVLTLMNGVFSINSGLFWLFLAALAMSLYNLLQRKLTKTYSGLESSSFSIFVGTILLSPFIPQSIADISQAPPIQLVYVISLGLFASAAAYVCWSKAFSKTENSSQVSNYMFLTPLVTSVLGFLMVGEIPDNATLLGGAIILLGLAVFNFGQKLFKPTS